MISAYNIQATNAYIFFFYNLQAQDHLLGVIVKANSANNKTFIVLVLTPELPSNLKSPSDSKDTKGADFKVLVPKSKRGLDDEYCSSVTARKGSGAVNMKLPHRGFAAGVNYEVREVDNKEFLSICNRRIKVDQVRLLEDVSAAAFSNTVQQLLTLKSDGNKYPPALDPVKGMNSTLYVCTFFSQIIKLEFIDGVACIRGLVFIIAKKKARNLLVGRISSVVNISEFWGR